MHILCPHCRNPIEVVKLTPREELACPSCGSSFRLETESTTGWQKTGDTLGRFQLLDMVGQGAFGTVYKARDPELDRAVAIKVPRAGNLAGPQDLNRFLREARSVAQLRHPSIVTVHEVGQTEGVPYLVSDFVQGVTLADVLTTRRPGFRETAELIAAVADALQYAHERGVVHRDVKPSNIMIGDDGRPCVMDFGLAKRDAGEITMTVEGQVLGTPAYMSPEQARGDAHSVDGRSDVYSLGIILYELLTGELPFRGNKRMLLHQVLHDEPRPPRSLNDHVPRDLETVCLKAMAKEPARRYPTARDLADDLRRWLAGEAIKARPEGRAERARRWVRRHPAAAALLAVSAVAGLAVVGLAVGLCYQVWLTAAYQAETAARHAEADQRARAETHLYFSRIALAERELAANNVGRAEQLLEECPGGLRGWEWNYLKRTCHRDLRTLRHAQRLNSVAYSPDGRRLVTVGHDRVLKVWDAATGQEVTSVPLPETGNCLAFSPEGDRLALGYWTPVENQAVDVDLFETATWGRMGRLRGHHSGIACVAFDARGARLASAADDQTVRVWDVAKGDVLWTVRSEETGFSSVAFHPGGRLLAGALGEMDVMAPVRLGKVIVWDANGGTTLRTLTGHEGPVTSVAFKPDGTELASTGYDQTVRVWDVATWKEVRTLRGHGARVTYVAYHPEGRQIGSCGVDGSVRVWDAADGRMLRTFRGHTGPVLWLAFDRTGRRLASAGYDGTAKVWDPTTDPDSRTLKMGAEMALGLAFRPDGRVMAATGARGVVKILDVGTGREVGSFAGHTARVWCCEFSRDGRRLLTSSEDETARVWDAAGGREAIRLKHPRWVQAAAFSPDSSRVVTACGDEKARVWDAETGRELLTLPGHGGRLWSVRYSPDGDRIASGGADKVVKIWDARTGRELATLRGHAEEVTCVRFSGDGRLLASANLDMTVKVWDAASYENTMTLRGHTSPVYCVAFSPDGKRLASSSLDQTVKVWDLSTGQELITLRTDAGGCYSVAFSPDGGMIAATGHDGTVRLWDATPFADRGPQ